MKSFLKYTLATIVGFLVVSILGVLIFIGIISAVIGSSDEKFEIKEHSMLQLKLDQSIVDRDPNDPLQDLKIPGLSGNQKVGLDAILSAIKKAETEDNIKGIFLRLEYIEAGYSTCQEIRNGLIDFKKSGKFIYAYSEDYTQKAYYIASVADKIFITPEGSLMFSGLSAHSMFFKKALDKLGIEMQVIRHGKFKAAVEPFVLDKMSPENREQVQVYIGSVWNNVVNDISKSRKISEDRLNMIADDNMMLRKANVLVQNGLVDSVLYEDQLLDFLRGKTGTAKNDGIPIVTVSDMKKVPSKRETKGLAKDKLAVIYAAGDIGLDDNSSSLSDEEAIGGRDLAKEIRKARTDSTIKAIVLRVNSPGGSALASELIWREVKLAAEQKVMVVSMGNLAASGGYYISCAADTIVANPTTITGSIGVFGLVPNMQELLEDKLGITSDVVKTNKLSDLPATDRPLTPVEKELFQNMVEDVYSTFVSHVAEGRGLTYEQVDAIGQGRVWTGENALQLGLVDVLGDLTDAVEIAKKMAGLKEYRIVNLPEQSSPVEELLKELSGNVKIRILKSELGENARYYKMMEQAKNSKGIMTRLPYNLEIE